MFAFLFVITEISALMPAIGFLALLRNHVKIIRTYVKNIVDCTQTISASTRSGHRLRDNAQAINSFHVTQVQSSSRKTQRFSHIKTRSQQISLHGMVLLTYDLQFGLWKYLIILFFLHKYKADAFVLAQFSVKVFSLNDGKVDWFR